MARSAQPYSGTAICVGSRLAPRFKGSPPTVLDDAPPRRTGATPHQSCCPGPDSPRTDSVPRPRRPSLCSGRVGLGVDRRDFDAGADAHRRRDGDLAQVDALARRRLGLVQSLDQRAQVAFQLVGVERATAEGAVDDAGLVDAELDLASLGVLDGGGDVRGHGANLGVRHQAARAQDLTQGTDDTHRVRRGDDHVEGHVARLDALGQVFHADNVSTSGTGFVSLGALGEDGDALGLAGAIGQHDGAANDLVRLLGIDAELHGNVDGLIELGGGQALDQFEGFGQRVQLGRFDLASQRLLLLGELGHVRPLPR
eukprot:m.128533 g.128533  ORF g.128533 m.128533 type:complete len:312 (-) comp52295_c0_seq7:6802-7737(-)